MVCIQNCKTILDFLYDIIIVENVNEYIEKFLYPRNTNIGKYKYTIILLLMNQIIWQLTSNHAELDKISAIFCDNDHYYHDPKNIQFYSLICPGDHY